MSQPADITIYGLYDECGVIKYVGRTKHLKRRVYSHRRVRAWVVGVTVLEMATDDTWRAVEKKWIAFYKLNGLDNKNEGGGGLTSFSDEIKQKISRACKGTKMPEEAKRKISLSLLGNKRSLGVVQSEESKQKKREAMQGRVLSDEHKEKIRLFRLGKPSPSKGKKWSAASIERAKLGWQKRREAQQNVAVG